MPDRNGEERGFVLITTLVILMILTIMLLGLYFRGKVNMDTSMSSRDSTKGYYLAEAGVNYLVWALYMDPSNPGADNTVSLDGDSTPDNQELYNTPDQMTTKTLGYFDTNDTIGYNPQSPAPVNLSTLVQALPAHVGLNITINGTNNTPSVSPEQWNNGTSIPTGDGAVVWVTCAVYDATGKYPLNEADSGGPSNPTATQNTYSLYAYSIGYVNGKPTRLLRAKLGVIQRGFLNDLGAMTNGYQQVN